MIFKPANNRCCAMLLRGTAPLHASSDGAVSTFTLQKGESAAFIFGALEQKEQEPIDPHGVDAGVTGHSSLLARVEWKVDLQRSMARCCEPVGTDVKDAYQPTIWIARRSAYVRHTGAYRRKSQLGLPLCLAAGRGLYTLYLLAARVS